MAWEHLRNAITGLMPQWGSGTGEYAASKLDKVSGALLGIDHAHHEIHAGTMFRVQANATAATLIIAFKVPDQLKLPHFAFEWVTESSGGLQLIEGPTWASGSGADLTVKNSRRDSANESILEADASGAWLANRVVIDPTTFAGGTVISDKRVYTDNKYGGGMGTRKNEIILAANTLYALKWTSGDGAKGVQIRCEWYEHADKY